MTRKVGRKTKLTEEQVNHLIYLFKTEKEVNGRIKYMDMYQFNKEMVQQGVFTILAGEDFWRKKNRLGREMIDKANSAFTPKVSTSNLPNDSIPNLVDLIDSHYEEKETLINELIIIERRFYKNVEERKKLELVLTESIEEGQAYKKQLSELEERFEYLQDLLFKMLRYSSNKEVPLVNHLDTGQKQTRIVKKALENIFSNPLDFYNWYEEKIETPDSKKSNVIPLKKGKTLADEFSDIF